MWLSMPIASAASLRARAGMSLSWRVLDLCGASTAAAVMPEPFVSVTLMYHSITGSREWKTRMSRLAHHARFHPVKSVPTESWISMDRRIV